MKNMYVCEYTNARPEGVEKNTFKHMHNSTVIKSQTVPLTDKTQHFAQLTLIPYVHVLICLLGI